MGSRPQSAALSVSMAPEPRTLRVFFQQRLAQLTTELGSVRYAIQTGTHAAQLRNAVTSPGGTTAAAMYELEKGGIRTVLTDAIWAAYRRSVELGKNK